MLENVLARIAVALETLAAGGGTAPAATDTKTTTTKKTDKPAAPSLEQVQDKIRALVAANEANAPKIKAASKSLGGERAGDFEGDAAKLTKLMAALTAIGEEADAGGDDDLL